MTSRHQDGPLENSAERDLWLMARSNGISRRRFLQLLSVGGAAAVLTACSGLGLLTSSDPDDAGASIAGQESFPGWFKDPEPFI